MIHTYNDVKRYLDTNCMINDKCTESVNKGDLLTHILYAAFDGCYQIRLYGYIGNDGCPHITKNGEYLEALTEFVEGKLSLPKKLPEPIKEYEGKLYNEIKPYALHRMLYNHIFEFIFVDYIIDEESRNSFLNTLQ